MKFEIYKNQQRALTALATDTGEWRWRLKAGNGEIIAQGEGYRNKQDCMHAIDLVRSTNATTAIAEV